MAEKINILGTEFDNITPDEAVDRAYHMVQSEGNHRIVTPNSEIVYMARDDEALRSVLNTSDMAVADGIGVVYASKICKTPLAGKVAGIELGEALLAKLAKTGERVFFLGAKPGVAEAAADALCKKYPGLTVCGVQDGYFQNDDKVIERINAAGAQVLFVCLGAPKQELWMAKNQDKLHTSLMLGLGGSLDVFAGVSQRAPDIWIRLGLEWFYRLCKEPWRIGRMMALPKFLLTVIFTKRKGKAS